MPLDLTPEQIKLLWDAQTEVDRRAAQTLRDDYYLGEQAILELDDERPDGSDRTKNVTNWIGYISDTHASFLTNTPYSYTLRDAEPGDAQNPDDTALNNYAAVLQTNAVGALDLLHATQAITMGFSIEVHSFDDDGIKITSFDPRDWVVLYDGKGNLVGAIYFLEVEADTWHNGAFQTDDIKQYTVYDDATKKVYDEDDEGNLVEDTALGETHAYGTPPVVVFAVNDARLAFITTALISQQDTYNATRSTFADDVKYNTDALLKIVGIEPDALFEEDDNGVSYWQKMKDNRLITLPPPAQGGVNPDAEFLLKGNDSEKVALDLRLSRDAIHLMGSVPDIAEIIGATGVASGIALKLKFQPLISKAGALTKTIEKGLRRRVDLVNVIWSTRSDPELVDYEVGFTLNVPTNMVEKMLAMPSVQHLLAAEDAIRLMPEIDDPAAAADRKRAENEGVLAGEMALIGGEADLTAGAVPEIEPAESEEDDGDATG